MTTPLRVLLIEDSEDDALLTIDQLEVGGYEVTYQRVQTAKDTTAALDSNEWDIILIDYSMPGFNGIEAIKLVRARAIDLPVILISGTVGEELAVQAMKAGANDYLMKNNMTRLVPAVKRELKDTQVRLEKRIAEESARKSIRALRTLSRCNEALMRATEETALMNRVCQTAVEEGEYAFAWAGFVEDGADQIIRPIAQYGFSNGYLENLEISCANPLMGQGPCVKSIHTGKPVTVNNIDTDPSFAPWREAALERNYRSVIALPLSVQGSVIGSLVIYASEPNDFIEDEVKLLTELADDLGFGITTLRERAQAERSRETQKRLALAVEQSADKILITDAQGNIQYVNAGGIRILGYTADEMIGKTPRMFDNDAQDEGPNRPTWDNIFSGETWSGPFLAKRKDGKSVYLNLTISPVRDSGGNITNYVNVGHDVTQNTQLQQQLVQSQKMEAIGTLAGGIAHDFNNVLFAITGNTELAMTQVPQDTKIYANLQRVLQAAGRAGDMVKQILTFSRKSELKRQPLDLGPITKECVKFLRGSIPTTIEIRQDIRPGTSKVLADPTQIHQVVMNLSTNAVHAMSHEKGILSVGLADVEFRTDSDRPCPQILPGSYLRLTVSDTGMGIPANIIDKIFEPFFTTKKVGEGTGLGLSVVHGIVTTHDGSIIVKSEPGKGTNVEIYFPVIEDAAQPEEASDTIDALPRGKERILVVDDEKPLIEMLQHVFGHLGYEVVGINGSVEALALFRRDPMRFDLVITDLTMPDMTGAELAKELLTVRPDIPVIIFTGCGQTLTEDQIKDLGVRAMITKPISMKDIAVVIRKILDEGGVGQA